MLPTYDIILIQQDSVWVIKYYVFQKLTLAPFSSITNHQGKNMQNQTCNNFNTKNDNKSYINCKMKNTNITIVEVGDWACSLTPNI